VAGVVLMKSPAEDYRRFGKTLVTVSLVMLLLSFLCCGMSATMGVFTNMMYY